MLDRYDALGTTMGAAGATHSNAVVDREAAAPATTTAGVRSVARSTCLVAQTASSCETGLDPMS